MHPPLKGYELRRWLGTGGAGEVYLAYHPATDRQVAIKFLHDAKQGQRFQNEARIQASVEHQHIAKVYDFCVELKRTYLVMEYVDGVTLHHYIRQRKYLSEVEALPLFGQVVSAVAYLHEAGIIHRDLKTDNVKITSRSEAKLLDFGIAKASYTPRFTREGHVVGTSGYMAPEQLNGMQDSRSDCWALGVILYEMLTGYLPFTAKKETEWQRKIAKGEYLSPSLLNPAVSKQSQNLIQGLLQTQPAKRLSANQVLDMITLGGAAKIKWLAGLKNLFKK
ncbi:hypothetical protein GCM10027275_14120 [Rhabdobacter roseus]|uniref:Serine/threonine-protein kinase n=1 Tax=Rhabdobacter roseus TaxID=1655419 RepID=A0A840TTK6_9BACT|nr:serine/threonine-protein kinase [Rhabdobacter roseus]MBB5283330.1 serine/threonine-protein kinase [Rhabdobacter roseus]